MLSRARAALQGTRRPESEPGPGPESEPAAPDPKRVGGPRAWVVSVGVLATLTVVGGAGAALVHAGGGPGGTAATEPAEVGGPTLQTWSAATLAAQQDPSASSGQVDVDDDVAGSVDDGTPVAGTPSAVVSAAGVSEVDRRAGVATVKLVQEGTGRLLIVPGSVPAPSPAPRMTVRVEIEEGIGADGRAFADFVLATLNDSRSWGHGGRLTFARTDGKADFRVILASPDTSERLCAPAQTRGTMSCGGGGKAVITMYRWMNGIPDYGSDRTGYRQYVINHEVGHVLGHGHAYCDPGKLAPVMVQQTKGLRGCLPNPWPFPRS